MAYSYAFSVLLSAFLLFQIQPMIGKRILPWFGGTPTVWSTVLLFFQVLLTAGYAYAYWLLGQRRSRRQATVHLAARRLPHRVVGHRAGLAVSPHPRCRLAATRQRLAHLGNRQDPGCVRRHPLLPASSNSTLMQAWFSRGHPGRTPYPLYALSNAGSLLALISYPILVERNLTLRAQAYLWSAGYVLFALVAIYLSWKTY